MTSQKRRSAKRPVLLEKKNDPTLCWVPGCNRKADAYVLSYDEDGVCCSADVMLCPKHTEEAAEAGQ